MSSRCFILALAFAIAPATAVAQETGTPAPTPTQTSAPAPINPELGIPSDFRLDGDNAQRVEPGPTTSSIPAARTTPSPAQQRETEVAAPRQEPEVERTQVQEPPAAQREVATPTPAATLPSNPTVTSEIEQPAQVDTAPIPTPSIDVGESAVDQTAPAEVSEGGWSVLPILFALLALAIIAMLVWWRRRSPAEAQTIERPEVVERPIPAPAPSPSQAAPQPSALTPQPTPVPTPAPTPAPRPVTIGSLVTKRDVNPSTLVSTRRRPTGGAASTPQQPAAAPTAPAVSGGVTTNLAAKRRAEAEALEKARREERERQSKGPAKVNRSISFDWS